MAIITSFSPIPHRPWRLQPEPGRYMHATFATVDEAVAAAQHLAQVLNRPAPDFLAGLTEEQQQRVRAAVEEYIRTNRLRS